eukprot:CAMPEP_0197024828 /NCGR_PEP_ID=MMETSP1384-20130603/5315_1 /TAXON_ID=29189 /ORGANISM="Ammonia sp." /LENGTH=616 /DNA_ID=CAMNT_0042453283 /DNA_START=49 /DNA_END=1899 /DNA_ORIENTATION=+
MAAEAKSNADDEKKAKSADELFKLYEQRKNEFESQIAEFPVPNNDILTAEHLKAKRQDIYRQMTQTYPMCHGGVLLLIYQFLLAKREYGSSVEKKLYKKLTIADMMHRIFTKRAVVFYQQYDSYMLRSGKRGGGDWQRVGSDGEAAQPCLKDYMSYDEILLSALCGVSSPTFFINKGSRSNCGSMQFDDDDEAKLYPMPAVYMGLIGARFETAEVMEYKLMIVQKHQNVAENGYGEYRKHKDANLHRLEKAIDGQYFLEQVKASREKFKDKHSLILSIFESFYSRYYFPLYDEIDKLLPIDNDNGNDFMGGLFGGGGGMNDTGNAKKNNNAKKQPKEQSQAEEKKENDEESVKVLKQRYFRDDYGYGKVKPLMDVEMFRQRIRVSLELFMFDSDERCKQSKQPGFCHLVGLGAGYWAFHKTRQDVEMVKVALDIIRDSDLAHIECLYFSWFSREAEEDAGLDGKETNNKREYVVEDKKKKKIFVQFGNRNPADPLDEKFKAKKCLICACYAWDGNSFPGNEYWFGGLSASGDPAAAACSLIAWSQNSEINKEYVNGDNTGFYFFDRETGAYEIVKAKDIPFANDPEMKQEKEKWLTKSAKSIPYKRDKFNNNNDKK